MKKHSGIWILFGICLVCLSFLGGFYIGRNLGGGDVLVSAIPDNTTAPTEFSQNTTAQTSPAGLLNINTATSEQLQELPGIGPALAQRIVAYRTANGPFSAPEELMNVSGIGAKRLEAIADLITTGG